MLKITLRPDGGFNVTFQNEPIERHYLKMDDDSYHKVDLLLRSVRERGCDSEITHLEYLDGSVVFYRHINERDTPIVSCDDAIWDLLAHLAEMRRVLLPLFSEDTNHV